MPEVRNEGVEWGWGVVIQEQQRDPWVDGLFWVFKVTFLAVLLSYSFARCYQWGKQVKGT